MKKCGKFVPIPTPESLARAALSYLSHFAASESSLRQVLENRLRQAQMRDENFAHDRDRQIVLRQEIENIITKHKKSGALNDNTFASMKVDSLRRAGRSRRFIEQKLAQKGVARDAIQKAVLGDDVDQDAVERDAALAFARRRRLGQFRKAETTPDQARKDLAAMARAGFAISVARKALQISVDEVSEIED
jgi:regulatory protein